MRVKLKSVFFALVLWLIRKRDGRNKANTEFPNSRGENYLFDSLLLDETGESYFTCLNMEPEENPLSIDFSRFRYEAGKEHRIRIDEPCTLPCSITEVDITRIRGPYRIDLTCNGENIPLRRLHAECELLTEVIDQFVIKPIQDHLFAFSGIFAFLSRYETLRCCSNSSALNFSRIFFLRNQGDGFFEIFPRDIQA